MSECAMIIIIKAKEKNLPFLTRWSLVRLCRHVALARPCETMIPTVAANLSLCSGSHLLTYCRSVGSELSSRGFWRYLYLHGVHFTVSATHTVRKTCIYLLISLLRTSTNFFISSISAGALI